VGNVEEMGEAFAQGKLGQVARINTIGGVCGGGGWGGGGGLGVGWGGG